MKTVLCFGDSNTHGTVPMQHLDDTRRFPPEVRWPGVLQGCLGAGWQVIEEGLPGRTIARDDPVEGEDRNALRYLPACLQTHRPLDAIVFMLGTNDLKARFGASADAIAQGAHALIDTVERNNMPGQDRPKVLLVCPPAIGERGCLAAMFSGGEARGLGLAKSMAAVAQQRHAWFLDGGQHACTDAVDGIHLTADSHRALGQAVAHMLLSRF